MSTKKNQLKNECIIHSEQLRQLTLQINEIHQLLGKHVETSEEFRILVGKHDKDIDWIKNVGAWLLGTSGLLGIVYGVITFFINKPR